MGIFLRLFDKNANFYMDEASDGLKKLASSMGDFSITTNPASSLLAQEIESRNEMLHALVKDKNDTPVNLMHPLNALKWLAGNDM